MVRPLLAASIAFLAACSGSSGSEQPPPEQTPPAEQPDGGQPAGDAGQTAPDAGPPAEDDAVIVSSVLPTSLKCGESRAASVTVRNTGTRTWTFAEEYRLGAVDDNDAAGGPGRVDVPAAKPVAPGETHQFTFTLTAPAKSGTVTTDWRMLRENIHWFGGTAKQDVKVDCTPITDFELGKVTIVASPDVRGFAATSRITKLEFGGGKIKIDHTKRGQWPPVVINPADGTQQEATIWVFFKIGGVWYGTGGERLRPNQTEKELSQPSAIGPGWLYDPNRWKQMTNYVPAPGEQVGFMVVAGSSRSDSNFAVQERTKAIIVPFPADNQTTTFPPFTWEEP